MVSFDVTSLFTNVPLNFTIDLILDKIYSEKLISTKLKREQFKILLELCTKEMHFTFDGSVYKQVDGVAMGSPLGPVLANIFMVELETKLIPSLSDKISLWQRYVDDTFTFIRKDQIDYVKNVLNNFHPDIKFTHEMESSKIISFLDVCIERLDSGQFHTKVYRKKTDTNLYIDWKSFSPVSWKIGTLKGLFRRAYLICSETKDLNTELNHLKQVFTKINGYPSRIVYKTLKDVKNKIEREKNLVNRGHNNINMVTESEHDDKTPESFPHICLPYKGKEGENIIRKFKKNITRILPNNVKPRFIYKGKKIGSFFSLKDPIKKEHKTNLVYGYRHKELQRNINYVGETNVRYDTRTHEHAFSDKKSSIHKHALGSNQTVKKDDFVILESGFQNTFDRKIAEALYIKELKPELNEQVRSYKLKLFN